MSTNHGAKSLERRLFDLAVEVTPFSVTVWVSGERGESPTQTGIDLWVERKWWRVIVEYEFCRLIVTLWIY